MNIIRIVRDIKMIKLYLKKNTNTEELKLKVLHDE